ncbi:MAG: PAS domain S-box protein [bacterium]
MKEEEISKAELLQKIEKIKNTLERNTLNLQGERDSEKRLRLLFDYAPDAFYIHDLKGNFIDSNKAAERITGYQKDELIGKNFFQLDLLSREEMSKARKALARNMNGLPSGPEEYLLYRKDQQPVLVEIASYPVKVQGKELILGIARDITQRKKAEHSYRAVFENTGTATIIIEEDKTISLANRQFEKLSSYSKEEIENKMKWSDFVVSEDLEKMEEYHRLRRQNGESPPTEYEFRLKDRKGNVQPIFLKIDMIPHSKQSVASLLDITKLKEAEEKARHLNRVLRTIRRINRIITQKNNREKLLESACQALIQYQGYHHAWFVLLDQDGKPEYYTESGLGQAFVPLAEQFQEGCLNSCGQLALQEKEVVFIKNPSLTCSSCPLSNKYTEGNGSMTICLEYEGKIYGFLSVSISTSFMDEPEEQALFKEIASDISFALQNIKLSQNHIQVKRELKHSEQEKSAILDITPDLIIHQDKNHEIIWVNQTVCASLQKKMEEIQGEKCYRLWAKREKPCEGCPVEKAWETGDMFKGEITTPDGRWWMITAMPISDEQKVLVGAMESALDITENKNSQRRIQKTLDATIEAMSKIVDTRDAYTAGHQERVSQLAIQIARELKLSDEEIKGIKVATLIHDIGKISIPSDILSKPSRLNDLEFGLIKNHPQIGYDILKEIDFPYPIAQIVLQHHERMNGSGYPNKLKGKDILLGATIIGVADTVEAMSSHRPYRPALGINAALDEITKNKGILYDSKVVDACTKVFRENKFEFKSKIG